jgi:hypothetical protein
MDGSVGVLLAVLVFAVLAIAVGRLAASRGRSPWVFGIACFVIPVIVPVAAIHLALLPAAGRGEAAA